LYAIFDFVSIFPSRVAPAHAGIELGIITFLIMARMDSVMKT